MSAQPPKRYWHARTTGMLVGAALLGGGCAGLPNELNMRAARYRLDVSLDPAAHILAGRATIDLVRTDETAVPDAPAALQIWLHPDLDITAIRASGAELHVPTAQRLPDASSEDFAPARYRVVLTTPAEALTLFVDYRGKLWQDVSVGEKPGEIHNFQMRAHISEEGAYLGDGYWYPQPAHGEQDLRLADFTLIADAPAGFELVASGESDPELRSRTGRAAWRSPFPLPAMVLVGGPHEVHRDKHGHVTLEAHLKPNQAAHASGLLAAVKRILDRYEPLIGPYPARQYTVVDNFFSSGFAFPCFTLLSSAVIDMGERAQTTHGYLDHEMLHSWWGNGIFVDPRDGNWCEALTSYATNYYGHVLDGNEEEARRKRRNYCHYFSRLNPEDDKPLGTFGLPGGCNRQIAYDKGAMVFHMLARRMGQDRFWAAMRRFTDESMGRHASWETIRGACEKESGQNLQLFFDQWVRRSGAPRLVIERAERFSANEANVYFSQGEPAFELSGVSVAGWSNPEWMAHPIGFSYQFDIIGAHQIEPVSSSYPLDEIELDPAYHILRRVPPEDIVPTTAATRRGPGLAVVMPRNAETQKNRNAETPEEGERNAQIQAIFESSYKPSQRIVRTAGSIEEGALAERCVLVLGDAVRDSYVAGFLAAIDFPITWHEGGFEFEGTRYDDSGDGLLCTVAHPGVPGGGVTVVYGNTPDAIPREMNIPMYEHSLVIFQSGRPVLRHDFERQRIVPVD